MERFLERTQNSDVLAFELNRYLESHAPKDVAKFYFTITGYGETEAFTDGVEVIVRENLYIPPDLYVRWRSLEPIPYGSSWHLCQRAIPFLEQLDQRPEIQAEFKRRGITPR